MTKEELEKEAEEIYTKIDKEFMDCQDEGEIFNLGYLAGAEPREKRIAELEKVCQDLSDKFDYQVKQVIKLEDENQRLTNLVASYMTGEEE